MSAKFQNIMKKITCPHCNTLINTATKNIVTLETDYINTQNGIISFQDYEAFDCDKFSTKTIYNLTCNACYRGILLLEHKDFFDDQNQEIILYPFNSNNGYICPPEVPSDFSKDFNEAAKTLYISPRASALLSRRCLQYLLREKANVKKAKLIQEITELISRNELPSDIAEDIDLIRKFGNDSAHPNKYNHSDELIEVEPGEAEWCLDILLSLFDYYFVGPAKRQQRKAIYEKKYNPKIETSED